MVMVKAGRANWANASARAKARKAALIDATRMKQLLQQDVEAISASIGEFGYRTELDTYAARMDGTDLVEAALSHNMDRSLNEVLAFCHGELRDMVAIYVERFAYANAKTVLRAIHSGADAAQVAQNVLPEENENNARWNRIVENAETLAEAVAQMRGPWAKALGGLEPEASLQEMEDTLDRHYYQTAVNAVGTTGAEGVLRKYLRMEIDHRNVINLLRAMRQNLSAEVRENLVLKGGQALTGDLLRQAVAAADDAALLDVLRRAPSFNDAGLEEAMAASRESGSLDPVVNALAGHRYAVLKRMSHLHPISALPVINYIERKVLEVQNLRLLVRGKAAGLDIEVIEAHLWM